MPSLSNASPFQRQWGILWCTCTIIYFLRPCLMGISMVCDTLPGRAMFWCSDMPLVNFMSSSPSSADTPSSRVAGLGTLLCPLQRLPNFMVAWGCPLPSPSWQYQVYPWLFQLLFSIIRRLNRLSFLMTYDFLLLSDQSSPLPVFKVGHFFFPV